MLNIALSVPLLEYESHLGWCWSGRLWSRRTKYLLPLSWSHSPKIHRGAERKRCADTRKASLVLGQLFSLQLHNLERMIEGCPFMPGRYWHEWQTPIPPTARAPRVLVSEHQYTTPTARGPASRFI